MVQLLRIVHDAIEDQRLQWGDWKDWKDAWLHHFCAPHYRTVSPTEQESLRGFWYQVHSSCLKAILTILNRVEKKRNEIESLRNGVSMLVARMRCDSQIHVTLTFCNSFSMRHLSARHYKLAT